MNSRIEKSWPVTTTGSCNIHKNVRTSESFIIEAPQCRQPPQTQEAEVSQKPVHELRNEQGPIPRLQTRDPMDVIGIESHERAMNVGGAKIDAVANGRHASHALITTGHAAMGPQRSEDCDRAT